MKRNFRTSSEPLDGVEEESEKAGLKLSIKNLRSSHHFMKNRRGKSESSDRFYFLGLQNHWIVTAAMKIKKCLLLGRKAMTNLESILKKQKHHFADKGLASQSSVFSISHVQM